MKTSEQIVFVVFVVVSALIVWTGVRDWLRKKRRINVLAARTQRPDEEFGRTFFLNAKRADIAVRVRRVLSENLEMPLGGLTPDDRLEEDLHAELAANPDLFWELEEEFGFKSEAQGEDAEALEKTLERLVTFQDLVEYVERKISDPTREIPGEVEDDKPSRAYDLAIRSVMPLGVGGLVIAVIGILLRKSAMQNIGVAIFLCGIAIWAFTNGAGFLRELIQTVRGTPWKEIRVLPLILLVGLTLFFLWAGYTVLGGILKQFLPSK